MKPSAKRNLLRMLCPAILLAAGGCAGVSTPLDFCAVYEPVATLHCGSKIQQLNVDLNNAVYMEFCKR